MSIPWLSQVVPRVAGPLVMIGVAIRPLRSALMGDGAAVDHREDIASSLKSTGA